MANSLFWVSFLCALAAALAIDLGVVHRRAEKPRLREAAIWSCIWMGLSLAFGFFLWRHSGRESGIEFFSGYLIEASLSADNLFVFYLLFGHFAVRQEDQHRVLYWGILGALAMRGGMIAGGIALIRRLAWVIDLLGLFLLYAGARMLAHRRRTLHPENRALVRWARKLLNISDSPSRGTFFTHQNGVWRATPLLLVLIAVEMADLAFAVDSIPAVFGVTRDPFIVFSSNACAILGLRSLYFVVAGLLPKFRYLETGLAAILLFVGGKTLLEHWLTISTAISLGVIAGILGCAVAASLLTARGGTQKLQAGAGPAGRASGEDRVSGK